MVSTLLARFGMPFLAPFAKYILAGLAVAVVVGSAYVKGRVDCNASHYRAQVAAMERQMKAAEKITADAQTRAETAEAENQTLKEKANAATQEEAALDGGDDVCLDDERVRLLNKLQR